MILHGMRQARLGNFAMMSAVVMRSTRTRPSCGST